MEKLTPQQVSDKVLELTERFNRYVFNNPAILDRLPDKAVLVFLDADDPAFNQANVELARAALRSADGPTVYVTMKKRVRLVQQEEWTPDISTSPVPA
jgi:hypothetical protein